MPFFGVSNLDENLCARGGYLSESYLIILLVARAPFRMVVCHYTVYPSSKYTEDSATFMLSHNTNVFNRILHGLFSPKEASEPNRHQFLHVWRALRLCGIKDVFTFVRNGKLCFCVVPTIGIRLTYSLDTHLYV